MHLTHTLSAWQLFSTPCVFCEGPTLATSPGTTQDRVLSGFSLIYAFFGFVTITVQGCLKPVKVIIPKGCMLNPSDTAAVVGGNVLTSQRVVDVILKAFGICAASQVRAILCVS